MPDIAVATLVGALVVTVGIGLLGHLEGAWTKSRTGSCGSFRAIQADLLSNRR
jgi:hypothetical protein